MARHQGVIGSGGRLILVDSITEITSADENAVVVSGSHGGQSSAGYALQVPLRLVSFSDAGVGKDGAGIAALARLQDHGVAAVAVAHTSARIGDARDMWAHGTISHANAAAVAMGAVPGVLLRDVLLPLVDR